MSSFINLNNIGMKVKKGDQIKIISGNDKGAKAKVIAVFPDTGKIVAEGINLKKKHARPKKQGQKGEIVKIPMSFHAARAMIICPKCSRPTRAGYKHNAAGLKTRVCKKCGSEF